MNAIQNLPSIIEDLNDKNKKAAARQLLDIYWGSSTELSEYEIIGKCALVCGYHQLHLKCAEKTYSMVTATQSKRLARDNLYRSYNKNNYPEKALFYLNIDLENEPDNYDLLLNKAINISLAGDKNTSDSMLLELLDKFPHKSEELHKMLAAYYMRQGNITAGILNFGGNYGNNIKYRKYFTDILGMEFWEGQECSGRPIVINAGGGHGDAFLFSRFFSYIKELGATPIYYSSHKYFSDIANIFERHGIETLYHECFFPKDAMWTTFLEIPAYLGLSEDQLLQSPHITPLRKEKNQLPKTDRLRIGFKCKGNPDFAQDIYRSIELEQMLAALPENAELYYIDKIKVNHPRVIDMCDRIDSWNDTLDIIDQMDVIVSTCTSLVHAAANMGKRTIVFTPIAEYFIWTSTRDIESESTPWYGDNLTLLKQRESRCWKKPLNRMSEILDAEFGHLQRL